MSEEAVNLEMKEVELEAEAEIEMEMEMEMEMDKSKKMKMEDGSAAVLRWERFLPRMVLRVLLVEADDSTRQIIAALLRKCNYKVAAVSDGLKAWELLKGKPHCIDLILTEVDLPSISGFALLTLIMEHEICKNIPVIMMSTHDSVSVVYNCMLRGAADFLVKPVRKNELKNLWQHVWRRQASASGGSGPQDESDGQQKVEATAENNATSNPSSGFMTCIQRNRECIEKGSDAQSSCTKPDLEGERAITENVRDLNPMNEQKQEECVKSRRKSLTRDCENRGSVVAASKDVDESERENANVVGEACDDNHAIVVANSSTEAIDLIGAFDNYLKYSYRSSGSNDGTNKVDSSLLLDLSLRRSHPSGSVNQVSDERHTLNHSDASAFSRYVNRAPLYSTPNTCNQQKDCGANSDRQLSSHTLNKTYSLPLSSPKNMLSQATGQSGQAQQSVISVPIPVRGVRLDSLSATYGSVMPPMFSTQSGLSPPAQTPGSAHHQEPSSQVNSFHPSNLETRNPQQFNKFSDQNANNSTNQTTEYNQRHKLESSDEQRYYSSANDQSASSSLCNGTLSRLKSVGCGSNGNVDHVIVVRAAAENGGEVGFSVLDRNCHRSVQREAALNKFRLKRKDRCFDKKVRYESRKKLAEQRPRVKGQFVRNVLTEMASLGTDNHPRG